MLTETIKPDIRAVARQLWEDSIAAEPALVAVYLFPSDKEIRLVHLGPDSGAKPRRWSYQALLLWHQRRAWPSLSFRHRAD